MMKKMFSMLAVLFLLLACTACRTEDTPPAANESTGAGDTVTAGETVLTEAEIAALVRENLELLVGDAQDVYEALEKREAHSEAFTAIVELGEAALPSLREIIAEAPYTTVFDAALSVLAKEAAYAIAPEEFDLVYPSPDGTRTVKLTVSTFNGAEWSSGISPVYKNASVTEGTAVLYTETDKYYMRPDVLWSPDSRYVVLEQTVVHLMTESVILDAESGTAIELPDVSEIESAAAEICADAETDVDYANTSVWPNQWREDGTVEMKFVFHTYRYGLSGTFVFDPATGKMEILTAESEWVE